MRLFDLHFVQLPDYCGKIVTLEAENAADAANRLKAEFGQECIVTCTHWSKNPYEDHQPRTSRWSYGSTK